ncbi:MAG TPA: hypothetical protein VIR56_06985 [Solimonas sp.]
MVDRTSAAPRVRLLTVPLMLSLALAALTDISHDPQLRESLVSQIQIR